MRFDEVFADGEAEATPLYFCAGDTEVTVEDTLMVTGIDAFAEVPDEYFHRLVCLACTDNDTAVLRRVMDSVGKEVCQHPGDLLAIDKEFGDLFRIFHLDMAIETLRLYPVRLDGIVDQFDRFGDPRGLSPSIRRFLPGIPLLPLRTGTKQKVRFISYYHLWFHMTEVRFSNS